jgi:hypothetical protein
VIFLAGLLTGIAIALIACGLIAAWMAGDALEEARRKGGEE